MTRARQTVFLALFLIAGCTCPQKDIPLHNWSIADQQQIAAEHNALPKDDVLRGVLDEWVNLRAALKQ